MKILKIPMENGLGKTKGCKDAPDAVIEALESVCSSGLGKEINVSSLDIDSIDIDNFNLEKSNKAVYEKAFSLHGKEKRVCFLGGDHSVSYSTTRSFFDYCDTNGKESCIIIFDAHPDLMEPVDKNFPTHEEWLRGLINDGFNPKNILLVGIRNSYFYETDFIKEKGIRVIGVNQILENKIEMCEIIMEFSHGKELYLSIDIDSIDPAFAPGTGYREPGGFSSAEFIYMMSRISKMKNLRALDLVEINPEKDRDNLTVKLGAKIISFF